MSDGKTQRSYASWQRSLVVVLLLAYVAGAAVYAFTMGERVIASYQQVRSYETVQEKLAGAVGDSAAVVGGNQISQVEIPSFEACESYNQQLANGGQRSFSSPSDYETPGVCLADYGIEDECFGVIRIPVIDVNLALFNGCSNENMAKGAALFGNTSYPLGLRADSASVASNTVVASNTAVASNTIVATNTVIAAHNVYNSVEMFNRISQLQPGDQVLIDTVWGTVDYRVVTGYATSPDDFTAVYIQPGRTLLTLTTCYQQDGRNLRYMVTCELDDESAGASTAATGSTGSSELAASTGSTGSTNSANSAGSAGSTASTSSSGSARPSEASVLASAFLPSWAYPALYAMSLLVIAAVFVALLKCARARRIL